MKKQKPLTEMERLAIKAKLLNLPHNFLFNAIEASIITGISLGGLANRRMKKLWPFPYHIPTSGRIIRYRHSDLLAPETPTEEAK
jgi:hypothetical protein